MTKKERIKNILINILVIVGTLLFINYISQLAITCGNSMNNTLHDGDLLITEKVTKNFKDNNYDRYDVIIFKPNKKNNENEKYYIKRIIGLPGETVRIEDGSIYINNNKLSENYGKEEMIDSGSADQEYLLKEDEFFVLGDNRNNSLDSRYIGPVKKEQILSHAIFNIFNFKKL